MITPMTVRKTTRMISLRTEPSTSCLPVARSSFRDRIGLTSACGCFLMLRQPEPVTRVVHHYGGSAPVLYAWRSLEFYAARFKLIVSLVNVVRIKDPAAEHAFVD